MKLAMVGLGRMGGNMAQRLMSQGHECLVHDPDPAALERLARAGAQAYAGLADLVGALPSPRVLWLMVPVAVVDAVIDQLQPLLQPGDVVVDGGNSSWRETRRRAERMEASGIAYMDVGTSGGVRGRERGYCLMVGGPAAGYERIRPLLLALAPGASAAPPTPGRKLDAGSAEQGYLHCGPSGAGHFVKMVHNAIEYGLMAAYAEGFNLLHQAGQGMQDDGQARNATPLAQPEHYVYDFDLPEIAELWRRGSVVGSWLLDLTAQALQHDPGLQAYTGKVSDSGEGRWALAAATDLGVPVPVLSAALFSRFESLEAAGFARQTLSAMRKQFGGHVEPERGATAGAKPKAGEP